MSNLPCLIPVPSSIEEGDGVFTLNANTVIYAGLGIEETAFFLAVLLQNPTGFPFHSAKEKGNNCISLEIREGEQRTCTIEVTSDKIKLIGSDPESLFAGCRILRQLLPPEIESETKVTDVDWTVPCVKISDSPRFRYRGLMLDPARGYRPVEDIMETVDLMVLYGLNRLHLHLTDDQGWCFEVPDYPNLAAENQVYSYEEIEDLVEYAQQFHIMIIPEVDMPGHTTAAVRAYPELCCRGVKPDKPKGGGNYGEILCPGNENVYEFVESVLSEVAELFPSPYIHIGGDEAVKKNWETCPECQQRMKDEKLPDLKALEHYFISRVEKIIRDLGKRMIGWDEILELDAEGIGHEVAVTYPANREEDPLETDTLIQSWRDLSGVKVAAELGHQVIAANQSGVYLNYNHKRLPLEVVYSYNPIPEGLPSDKKTNIIGVETCLWGGLMEKETRELKLFPRICAVAENAWSLPENKNLADFKNRLIRHRRRWDVMGVSSYPVNWVTVTYDHPDVQGNSVSEFELTFTVENSGDEAVYVTGVPAEGSGILMDPGVLNIQMVPGEVKKVKAVFSRKSGWKLNDPEPFVVNWTSAFGEVQEEWSLSIAPERKFNCPVTEVPMRMDGNLSVWKDRMPFEISDFARFGVCRDDDYIYLGLYVSKDAIYSDSGRLPFEQDGVEIRFDLRGEMDRFFSDGEIEFKDIIPICISPAFEGKPYGAFYRKDDLPEGVRAVSVFVRGGYLTETAIPSDCDVFRVNVCVNQSDGEEIEKNFWRPAWRNKKSFPWSGTFYFRD